jgi:hypothetical protein
VGRASRDKGVRGEREVEGVFRAHGLDCWRTPNSGGLRVKGDLQGLDGWYVEVKRRERLDVPGWLGQAYEGARGEPGLPVPVVVFRRSFRRGDPASRWHAVVPLDVLAELIRLGRETAEWHSR